MIWLFLLLVVFVVVGVRFNSEVEEVAVEFFVQFDEHHPGFRAHFLARDSFPGAGLILLIPFLGGALVALGCLVIAVDFLRSQ